jgi:hypothetical protein
MELISERTALSVALVPQTITNTNVTGLYHNVRDFHRICMYLQVGAMAASKTVTLEIFQGIGRTGASGALIAGASAVVAANVLVSKATITTNTVQAADYVEVNGLRFTAHGSVTDVSIRQFSCATGNNETAAQLAICLNDPTYGVGVPGLTASAASAVVTLVSTEPGETLISTVTSGATLVLATLEASAYVECENLDLTFGDHVAAKVTSTATGICSVTLLREARTQPPAQMVGAATAL